MVTSYGDHTGKKINVHKMEMSSDSPHPSLWAIYCFHTSPQHTYHYQHESDLVTYQFLYAEELTGSVPLEAAAAAAASCFFCKKS